MLLLGEPSLGADEKHALADAIDSGWITMGERVRAFELAFAREHGAADAAAVSSCTAGLHLALEALDIGPGDEVLVPSLTFVATVNSVLYAGATPVFVDIESLDMPLLSFTDAAAKCTPRTKAIIVMHFGGYVRSGEMWRDFARTRRLHLIEDAAHAAGLNRPSVFGDIAVFSFFGNKNMTTAEGGMVITGNPDILATIKQMRSHGMTTGTTERLRDGTHTYDVTMLGYNYRMDDLRAAVGLAQLENLRQWNQKRERLTIAYRYLLSKYCPMVSVPFSNLSAPYSNQLRSAYHILAVVLPQGADRTRIADRLREAGIQTSMHYPPIHRFSWYQKRFPSVSLLNTEEFCRRELTLPLHPKMTVEDAEKVAQELAAALRC